MEWEISDMADHVDPWSMIQPRDLVRMGEAVLDRAEQERWSLAVMLAGSLPYMWRHKAAVVRELIYDKLRLVPGHRVLVIGEVVEGCGFDSDIRQRVGPSGDVQVIDITDEARDAYFAGRRGRGGQLATWPWHYTDGMPAESFDAVAILQAVQHTDDWQESGKELLRLIRPGGVLMLAEITFSPRMKMLAEQDIHIETWIEKLASRVGFSPYEAPYYSAEDLLAALSGLLLEPQSLVWKGIEIVWGGKPGPCAGYE